MSKVQILRSLVKQRLTAAAEEICALFERTIAEYEEELCRSTEQNQRHRNLLDSALTPQLRLHRADVQRLLFGQKKVSPKQQEWSSSLDQQDPEPPHIKDEQEELWTYQEEADITEFTFTLVPVKHEDDDEVKPQSSQTHQRQTEQMEAESDGQDCGGPEPARNSVPDRHLQSGTEDRTGDSPEPEAEDSPESQAEDSPEPEAEDSPESQAEDSTESETEDSPEPQAEDSPESEAEDSPESQAEDSPEPEAEDSPESQAEDSPEPEAEDSPEPEAEDSTEPETEDSPEPQAEDSPEPEAEDNYDVWSETKEPQSFSCCECGKRFNYQCHLDRHRRIHTGEKPFSCRECCKRFTQQQNLIRHTKIHTGEKPFSCGECGKRFSQKQDLIRHRRIHTGEKPYSCGECCQRFNYPGDLKSSDGEMKLHEALKLSIQLVHTWAKASWCFICSTVPSSGQ
uniref:C2H2-type domain-containing protein n=1 Tax=Sparus aurata TaxID=8175 RepID=A0A671UAE7_SPAAU